MAAIKFKAGIERMSDEGAWAMVRFPLNVSKRLGTKARVAVKGSINGYAIRTSAFPNGDGSHHIMFNKEMRAGTKADIGDTVLVEVELDTAERAPLVPPELKRAIDVNASAKKVWTAITPRAKEEWVEWIASAKKDDTRTRRIEKAVERLSNGERRVYD
ncbi:MAG: DUF1905 domain-containing protein [Phycisphaerae bacterium]|nr:DUF1905 domain-containing protein [Phycisphaerae bacterium]